MIWNKTPVDAPAVKEMARRYEIDLLTAAILARRGMTRPETLRFVLQSDVRLLHNPFLMSSMNDAVERINAAVDSGEKILIFGDRDVDGITATVLLFETLTGMEGDVQWMLPEGEDGYGLSEKVIEQAVSANVGLIVTVDCGVSNVAEIARAAALGIDTIVIDHHNPPAELPAAVAVVDPKIPGLPLSRPVRLRRRGKGGMGAAFFPFAVLRRARLPPERAAPRTKHWSWRPCSLRTSSKPGVSWRHSCLDSWPWKRRVSPPFARWGRCSSWTPPRRRVCSRRAFGPEASLSLSDIAPLVAQFLPQSAGKSLLRLQEASHAARYSSRPLTEIDTLVETFTSLVLAREGERLAPAFARMDLVTLGTLADLMPLVDENRVMVRAGLGLLRASERSGLRQVFKRKDLLGKRITTSDIAWQVSPLLNSAGRMGDPSTATRLFLAQTAEESEKLVEQLFALDGQRKSMGEATWNLMLAQAKESLEKTGGRCILVHDQRIQRGITGIMASRLQGFFRAPAIVIAEGDDMAVGSIRCNRDRVIADFFSRHGGDFLTYGGHDFAGRVQHRAGQACGIPARRSSPRSRRSPPRAGRGNRRRGCGDPLSYLSPELQKTVDLLEPYGEGNPQLVFLTRGMRIVSCDLIGRKELSHLKLLLDTGKNRWPAVFWNAAARFPGDFAVGDVVDVLYRLGRNTYGGGESLQLTILDVKK